MALPDEIKDPPKIEKAPQSLVIAAAATLPLGKLMLQVAYEGKYKKLRNEKGFDKYPEVSLDRPKALDLGKRLGKGKQLDLFMTVFGDMLFMMFDALKDMPDAGTITAYEVVNYKSLLPKMVGAGDEYEFGLRVKKKDEVIEWDQLRNKSAKEIAALIPTVPEIVIVISKK